MPALLLLIEIYTSKSCVWIMISIVISNFVLSSVNKVTAGTFESFDSFVSVVANVPEPLELAITQFADQVRIISTSQLIKSILRVLQKLIKYYQDIAISATFVLPSARVLPVIFVLNLNVSESFIVVSGSPLQILQRTSWCFWIIIAMFY